MLKPIPNVPMPEKWGKMDNLEHYTDMINKKTSDIAIQNDNKEFKKLLSNHPEHNKDSKKWSTEETEEHQAHLLTGQPCYFCRANTN